MDPKPNEAVVQPTPTSTPPPIINSENKPMKSHKTLFFLLGIFIVFILVSGITCGYFLRKNNSSNKVTQSPSPTISQSLESYSPTPTAEPISSWKTYENNNLNYSFSYPSNWYIYPQTKGDRNSIAFHVISPESPSKPKKGDAYADGDYITVTIYKNLKNLSIKEWLIDEFGIDPDSSVKNIKGVNWEFSTIYPVYIGGKAAFIKYKDMIIDVSLVQKGSPKISQIIFEDFLSTFKFKN